MKIKIYYEDTDAAGVVYYANYLRYLERARTEFLSGYDIDVAEYHNKGFMFVIARVEITYKQPARLGDIINVTTEVAELNNASLMMMHKILRGDTLIAEAYVKVACVNKDGRPQRIPQDFRKLTEAVPT